MPIVTMTWNGNDGALRAVNELGIEVPRDLLLASTTDSPSMVRAEQRIIALTVDFTRLCSTLLDLLTDRVHGTPGAERTRLPMKLSVRESTDR